MDVVVAVNNELAPAAVNNPAVSAAVFSASESVCQLRAAAVQGLQKVSTPDHLYLRETHCGCQETHAVVHMLMTPKQTARQTDLQRFQHDAGRL